MIHGIFAVTVVIGLRQILMRNRLNHQQVNFATNADLKGQMVNVLGEIVKVEFPDKDC